MNSSRQLRQDFVSASAKRSPLVISSRRLPVLTRIPCGIPYIDQLLEGGFPHGALSELSGGSCAGRTTLALHVAAQVTSENQICAWIDATDAFDPVSAKLNSLMLDRLLWVRCGVVPAVVFPGNAPERGVVAQTSSDVSGKQEFSNSLHPRSEAKGLDQAVKGLLDPPNSLQNNRLWTSVRQAKPGTPGAPNLSIASSRGSAARSVQVATDRLPARRGAHLLELHKAETRPVSPCKERANVSKRNKDKKATPWNRVDQALRAADLLMQGGGFGAVVLDLGGIAPQAVNRIPLATWFRFRAAAERSRICFILLTQHPCAQSSAEVSLRVSLDRAAKGTVMTSLPIRVEVHRQRFQHVSDMDSIRKGPQRASPASWNQPTSWAITP